VSCEHQESRGFDHRVTAEHFRASSTVIEVEVSVEDPSVHDEVTGKTDSLEIEQFVELELWCGGVGEFEGETMVEIVRFLSYWRLLSREEI
jgi:hypothetical protein